jgi:hypothetical protein
MCTSSSIARFYFLVKARGLTKQLALFSTVEGREIVAVAVLTEVLSALVLVRG